MEKTLIEEAKKMIERHGVCSCCGFNFFGHTAQLDEDCVKSECKLLRKAIADLRPYYNAKMKLLSQGEVIGEDS